LLGSRVRENNRVPDAIEESTNAYVLRLYAFKLAVVHSSFRYGRSYTGAEVKDTVEIFIFLSCQGYTRVYKSGS
jgi:hypothetical protein